ARRELGDLVFFLFRSGDLPFPNQQILRSLQILLSHLGEPSLRSNTRLRGLMLSLNGAVAFRPHLLRHPLRALARLPCTYGQPVPTFAFLRGHNACLFGATLLGDELTPPPLRSSTQFRGGEPAPCSDPASREQGSHQGPEHPGVAQPPRRTSAD